MSIPGWSTKRRIIVVESDDWGSIRMPSRAVFDRLRKKGIDLSTADSLRYNLYDTLASAEDFDALYQVLQQFRDGAGRHPVFTAVSLVANPDFEKIRSNKFDEYHYERFTETLKRYYPVSDVFQYWQQGIGAHLFFPEFHGREHLNVSAWMKALQGGDDEAMMAFDQGMWGYNNKHPKGVSFQAAFDLEQREDIMAHRQIVEEGLGLFEDIFGYKASFFVPPNGIMHEDLYDFTASHGIEFMYTSKWNPVAMDVGVRKRRFNYLGKKNRAGQLFIARNAFFEPSQNDPTCVQKCLNDIALAFQWNKPAIISSHRVNYIGAIDVGNRNRGLDQLRILFKSILSRWPDVEFMTSPELGRLMSV